MNYEMYLTYFVVQLHVFTGIVPISGSELLVCNFTDTSLCPKFKDTTDMVGFLPSSLLIILMAIS
jgi:hypothetical protein